MQKRAQSDKIEGSASFLIEKRMGGVGARHNGLCTRFSPSGPGFDSLQFYEVYPKQFPQENFILEILDVAVVNLLRTALRRGTLQLHSQFRTVAS